MSSAKPILVYKASAGSGKTYTLAAEFIANLISDYGQHTRVHSRQLAITFTKKATAEMKERILQNLWAVAQGADADFLATVRERLKRPLSDQVIAQRAKTLLTEILHGYDHFNVTTIDSFFQKLLSNMAYEVGLSPNFKVALDDKEVLSKAVDLFLRELDPQTDHEQLSWLSNYMREQLDAEKSWRVQESVKQLSSELLKEAFLTKGEAVEALQSTDIDHYKKLLYPLRSAAQRTQQQSAQAVIDFVEQSEGWTKIAYDKDYRNKLTKYATWDLPDRKSGEFGARFLKACQNAETLLKKPDRAKLATWGEEVSSRLAKFVDQANAAWWQINSVDSSLRHLNPLLLLGSINQVVRQINGENNRFMLAHTPALFDRMVSKEVASFIFERAGTQFDHVMIDEFQDTSSLQWRSLQQLVTENIAAGQSCMLVGDVKQGIYRWRGGDWTSMSAMQPDAQTEIRSLRRNFRSGAHIVAFNNAFFVAAAAEVDALTTAATGVESGAVRDIYTPQWRTPPESTADQPASDEQADTVEQLPQRKGGFVRVCILPKTSRTTLPSPSAEGGTAEEETPAALIELREQIERLHTEGVPYEKMAILLRANKEAPKIIEHPLFADLPLVSSEAFLLSSAESIRIIIAALRLLASARHIKDAQGETRLHFSDELAQQFLKARAPKGEWEEIWATLCRWAQHEQTDLPLYQRVLSLVRMFRLDENEVEISPWGLETDSIATAPIAALPAAEATDTRAKTYETRHYGEESAYLYAFLDQLLSYLDSDSASLHRFLRYWDETLSQKSIPSSASKGIQLLTVHKSKGLDFHSVFLPFCHWKLEEDKGGNYHWIDWEAKLATLSPEVRQQAEPYAQLPLIPITHSEATKQSIYATEYAAEHLAQRIENLNLLYVAFTRARQNLVVCGTVSSDYVKNKREPNNCAELLHRVLTTLRGRDTTANQLLERCERMETPNEDKPAASDIPALLIAEFGQPSALECGKAESDAPQLNPLIYTAEAEQVDSKFQQGDIRFRQSNAARDFYAELSEKQQEARANTQPLPSNAAEERDWRARVRAAQQLGNLIHLAMEQIDTADDLEPTLAQLPQLIAARAQPKLFPDVVDIESLRSLLKARLAKPEAAAWFEQGRYQICREISILYRDSEGIAQTKRPDRVMIAPHKGEAIVVDYKTGLRKTEHFRQVEEYCQLLRKMGYAEVRGYLWYLHHGQNEILPV